MTPPDCSAWIAHSRPLAAPPAAGRRKPPGPPRVTAGGSFTFALTCSVDHEVLIVNSVGRREVARYRFVGARPLRRHRNTPAPLGDADAAAQIVAAETNDTLGAFMTRLLDSSQR